MLPSSTTTPPRITATTPGVSESKALRVRVGHASAAGPRERNEDFCGAFTPEGDQLADTGVVLAVGDGVSGSAGGREAAEHAVRGLLADYYAAPATWEVIHALNRVLTAVNTWIIAHGSANRALAEMATTLSALVPRETRWYIAHVGDSAHLSVAR